MRSAFAQFVTEEKVDGVAMGHIDPATDLVKVQTSKLNGKVFASMLKFF